MHAGRGSRRSRGWGARRRRASCPLQGTYGRRGARRDLGATLASASVRVLVPPPSPNSYTAHHSQAHRPRTHRRDRSNLMDKRAQHDQHQHGGEWCAQPAPHNACDALRDAIARTRNAGRLYRPHGSPESSAPILMSSRASTLVIAAITSSFILPLFRSSSPFVGGPHGSLQQVTVQSTPHRSC
ncbi:hypothetical protein BC628DRAFT_126045 [Trametes gibbosa]|nr:hypothetical protein BC628DRAFT_126045 [Trametes gibbosa]